MPATNGLLENTDSHASQSRELGREAGRIWSEAEGRVVSERWRKTHNGQSGSEGRKIKSEVPLKQHREKKVEEKKTPMSVGAVINVDICSPFSLV